MTRPTLDPDLRPRRAADVARSEVDGWSLLCTERNRSIVTLDPVSSVLWDQFDGTVTWSVLAEDLSSVTGRATSDHIEEVSWLVRALAAGGFIEAGPCTHQVADDVVARRLSPVVPPTSCLGRRIGLGRMQVVLLPTAGGAPIRIGTTLADLLESLVARHGTVTGHPADDPFLDTLYLRGSRSSAGHRRTQQIFDGCGTVLHAGRDLDAAASAFRSTVASIVADDGSPTVATAAVTDGRSTLLLHPRLRDLVTGPARQLLEFNGLNLVTACRFAVTSGSLELPPDPDDERARRAFPLTGVAVPAASDAVDRRRELLHLATRWDPPHLAMIERIERDEPIHEVDTGVRIEEIVGQLVRPFSGR